MKVAAPLQPPPSPEISADAKWHNRLGSLLSASKKYADAIAHFEQALVHAPRYAAAHFNLGSALVFDKGASMSHHIQRAVDHFRQAVDIQPHFPDAHVNLAAQLYAQGHFADALRHATTAISQDPDNIHAYYNLNTIYRALGQQDVAVELCWKRILSALLQPTTSRLVLSRPHDQQPEVVSHVHITVVCREAGSPSDALRQDPLAFATARYKSHPLPTYIVVYSSGASALHNSLAIWKFALQKQFDHSTLSLDADSPVADTHMLVYSNQMISP
ncbi:hypothetical protein DYB26_009248 [Aphanomyces astaci]|uniref:Uncharacterized protein n=1 Tax=Aphanomyces astaci TaxID=112090 RepID=A0A418E9S9_APHAT|nr:hypothetical protein DYB26_009248 [Aphanomyces astaci]